MVSSLKSNYPDTEAAKQFQIITLPALILTVSLMNNFCDLEEVIAVWLIIIWDNYTNNLILVNF